MIGGQALLESIAGSGVAVCFMNPGTSEMHVVHCLDSVPRLRAVLTLFEGVATGAADGYARIADAPAAALLHLGPGLANGIANLHNARRAHSPLLCIVGAHATYHERYDAPLQSDIVGLARTVSGWVRTSGHVRDVGADAVAAVRAAVAGHGVATLVVPADVSWSDGAHPAPPRPVPEPAGIPEHTIAELAARLRRAAAPAFLLGGTALRDAGLRAARTLARASGARLIAETFPARIERGAGRPVLERLGYFAEAAERQLAGVSDLFLAGARAPVAFFAYPGRRSDLVPDGCAVHRLADPTDDAGDALERLADLVAPAADPQSDQGGLPPQPSGPITPQSLAAAVAVTLPDDAVVVNEANTSGAHLAALTSGAPRHSVLALTGGAIGQGLPVALGAAIAAPQRPVLCLESDGSAMYTLQALWTIAREKLDVTVVLLNNGGYAILRTELARVGAGAAPGPQALQMLELTGPDIDYAGLAAALGVPARVASTAEDLAAALRDAYREPGPHLVEATLAPGR